MTGEYIYVRGLARNALDDPLTITADDQVGPAPFAGYFRPYLHVPIPLKVMSGRAVTDVGVNVRWTMPSAVSKLPLTSPHVPLASDANAKVPPTTTGQK